MKRFKSVISLFLIIVLSLSLPINVAAQTQLSTEETVARLHEVEALRETNSETYLLSNGSYECVVYAEDKYYLDNSKTLQPIDNSIKRADTATFTTSGQYKNTANAFDVYFSDSGTPKVDIVYNESGISFTPIAVTSEKNISIASDNCVMAVGAIENCTTLDDLTATGDNTVIYNNAFPDTDLVYVLNNSALKEYIVLNSKNASNEFRFMFTLDNVTMETTGNSAYFTAADGSTVFALDTLFAVDANGVVAENLTYSFAPVAKTNKVAITVVLDQEYLTSSDRAFPVVIDPTIMISSSETLDACVCSNTPDTNYRMSAQLRTGYEPDYGIRRSYIKFNIPSSIPAYSIINATLDIEKVSGVAPTIKAYLCMSSWSSNTITWRNQPTGGENFIYGSSISVPFRTGSSWYTMNVTDIVSKWVNNTYENYGFIIKDVTENDPDYWTTLYSSDADSPHKPELHIEYECESINLQVICDNPYAQRFSNSTSRITTCLNKLQEKYLTEFGISINYSSPSINKTYADGNCKSTYTTLCSCGSSVCVNSQFNSSGFISYASLHHTNIFNILARVGVPASNTTAKIVYIGRKMCESINGVCTEVTYVGRAFEPIRMVTVMNYTSTESEIASTIHEIGHLYGVIDHYGGLNSYYSTYSINQQYPDRGYNRRCIYGEGKFEDSSVTRDIIICDGCKSWIIENRDKFSG